ncbi:MAG: hypothetical protein ACR2JU_12895 [Nocardioidaceae bacterium]
MDPTTTGADVTTTAVAPTSATDASPDGTSPDNSVSCGWWVDVGFKHYSLLHTTIYAWHHKVVYCLIWNQQITSWQARFDFMSYASSVVDVGSLTANSQWGLHSMRAYSFKQRHVQLCVVKYGCYANLYPHSEIWVGAVGRWGYSGGAT